MYNQQPEPAASAGDRDEAVSLADLWRVLVARRWLIVATFAVVVAAACGYIFLKSPVYEASARIRVGQVAGTGLIETVEVLSTRLMTNYGEIVAVGVKRPRPFLSHAGAPRGVSGVIELTAEGDTPDDAVALLERIHAEIQQLHGDAYRRGVALLSEALKAMESRRQVLQQQIDESSTMMEQLGQRNPDQAALVMIERARIAALITELDAQKPILAQRLLLPQTVPTQLVGPIAAPAYPAAPKKVLILVFSGVVALMVGVVLALVADFLARARH